MLFASFLLLLICSLHSSNCKGKMLLGQNPSCSPYKKRNKIK
uniref:Uncharacterized protein n=1 Tax=Rhizophora mucronata TaxID=61149 RepID=A0A2P2P538_RHIMU